IKGSGVSGGEGQGARGGAGVEVGGDRNDKEERQFMRVRLLLLLGIANLLVAVPAWSASPRLASLRCEEQTEPIGLDATRPRFSWWIEADERDVRQRAYRLLVASSAERIARGHPDLWDSGVVTSSENTFVRYGGKPLASARTYYWKLQVWDRHGHRSRWQTASFTTGVLNASEWDAARWIAYDALPASLKLVPGVHGSGDDLGPVAVKRAIVPYFRRTFRTSKPVRQALVFVSGLGQYELSLNGRKVGDDFLTPAWTNYAKRVAYNTYDVTAHVVPGENVIGAIVGTGFFYVNRERYRKLVVAQGYPMLRLKLMLRFADGSVQEIVTDEAWKTAPSPIVFSSIYGGEDYDARREATGWDARGLDDSAWRGAVRVAGPSGVMHAQREHPLRVMARFPVQRVISVGRNRFVVDFGQNASGIVRLVVQGPRGAEVKITPAELLDERGLPDQRASGAPYSFGYTLRGAGKEVWTPRFTYYGFRYALVEGAVPPGGRAGEHEAQVLSLGLLHTRNGAPDAGTVETSSRLFNRIFALIRWAIRSNLASVPTDCPHREKLGWLEQAYLLGGAINYNVDVWRLFNKTVDDMMEAQLPNGLVPDIAPEYVEFEEGFRDSPEWGSASVLIPWHLYRWYGDTEALARAYDMMTRYVAFLGGKANGHILSHGLGDWFDLGPKPPGPAQLTPLALTATATYYRDVRVLSHVAAILGKGGDARRYRRLADEIRVAFNRRFFDARSGRYATGSQTSYAMPLYLDLVDERHRPAVVRNLLGSIVEGGKALTAGDIGFHYVVKTLEAEGASQLLFDMNSRDDVPGYGFQLKQGATALTESWQAFRYVSNNHMMLGHLMEWFYTGLAGLRQAPDAPGFRRLVIAPQMVDGIDYVKASYVSVQGKIGVSWRRSGSRIRLRVTVPGNTRASVEIPVERGQRVTEGGMPLDRASGVEVVRRDAAGVVARVGSGSYEFLVQ
ncbi:MAG: family 78 glycoside hydrolase catalytic domain, partial [Vicinamibacteraceae bacterium]